jgi:superfamily II DNA or RNA helicase
MNEDRIIQVYKLNEATLKLIGPPDFALEISEAFSFLVPGAKYTPMFRSGRWDGFIRLFNIGSKTLPSGLYSRLLEIADERGYSVLAIDNPTDTCYGRPGPIDNGVTIVEIMEYMQTLNLHGGGSPIDIREYQYRAVHLAISTKQGILKAATGAGKSLIVYCIARYITEVLGGRMLVIVPTIGLTTQFQGDFKDYSSNNGYDVDENVHLISGGVDKTVKKPIVISTFQSLKNEDPDFFNSFTCILTDEGHKITSASFKTIYGKATEVQYRLACTGTLHDLKCNILEMMALTGPVHEIASAKDLIAAGQLVPLKIKGVQLNYPEEICKAFKKVEYEDEIGWITTNPKRNNFIAKLAVKSKGTTLVLFRFIEQGKKLYEKIKELSTDGTPVYLIDGSVSKEERESIRLAANSENAILIFSYGTSSTGLNLPAIENIIVAHPVKSKLTYLQSIGRGLRLKEGKTHCNLYDISDNMTYKKKPNTTFTHFGERLRLLTEEGYQFDIVMVDFK